MVDRETSAAPVSPGKEITARLLVAAGEATAAVLRESLGQKGFACIEVEYPDVIPAIAGRMPDAVILEINPRNEPLLWRLAQELKKRKNTPVVALVAKDAAAEMDGHFEIDDFVIYPCEDTELAARINRLLHKTRSAESPDQIKGVGLTIDLVTCEVAVDGNKVDLTFKEYELLKLMAGSKGRVFTRQALLDKIWGYDYFGGDRTVDVHVRRLRSKIEDSTHTYIETVRNIGYRFKKSG